MFQTTLMNEILNTQFIGVKSCGSPLKRKNKVKRTSIIVKHGTLSLMKLQSIE